MSLDRCGECRHGYWGSQWVPHLSSCERGRWRRPAPEPRVIFLTPPTPEQQDAEAAALRRIGAPVPVPNVDWDCPCDPCEDARRKAIKRAGVNIPGLSPKGELPEPWDVA